MLKFQIDDDILMKCEWHADYSRPHSELKYSMTIRPATHGMKSGSDSGPPSIQMASATAGSSASATASAPSGAPGTPPHDSLGYFSEPEIIITPFDGSVSDISVWNFPPFLFLIYWIPAKQREPDIDSAKRISSGLPKKGGNAALLKRKWK